MTNTIQGYLLTTLSALVFTVASLLTKYAYEAGMTAWSFTFVYSALALVTMAPLLLRRKAPEQAAAVPVAKPSWTWFLLFAVTGSGAAITFNLALERLPISLGTILLFTYPAWVAVESWLLLRKRPTLWHTIAMVITLVGAVLITDLHQVATGNLSAVGIVLALSAAVLHALYLVSGERLAGVMTPLRATAITRAVILAGTLLIYPTVMREVPALSGQAWLICLITTAVAGVAPFFFLYRGIALIGANKAALVSVIELPFALALGVLFQGEHILPAQLGGGLLIGLALLLSQRNS